MNEDGLKVQLRGGFSDRNKIKSVNIEMQFESIDERTRISLVNTTHVLWLFSCYFEFDEFLKKLLSSVYMQTIDGNRHYFEESVFEIIQETILTDDYDSVITLIEYLGNQFELISFGQCESKKAYNDIFEKEYVGYRFVGDEIVSITSKEEISAINEALESPYETLNTHFKKAVSLLADRVKPDYENSIKESISAVEAICSIIVGKGTLGATLKKLEDNGVVIHSSLKEAFNKLYGFTSDASGVRHASNIGGINSSFEEAKFMLVTCSAFVNYLLGVWKNKGE